MPIMEHVRCPSCNSRTTHKHCKGSHTCTWFICPCEATTTVRHLVFDRKGRCFLEMKK